MAFDSFGVLSIVRGFKSSLKFWLPFGPSIRATAMAYRPAQRHSRQPMDHGESSSVIRLQNGSEPNPPHNYNGMSCDLNNFGVTNYSTQRFRCCPLNRVF